MLRADKTSCFKEKCFKVKVLRLGSPHTSSHFSSAVWLPLFLVTHVISSILFMLC